MINRFESQVGDNQFEIGKKLIEMRNYELSFIRGKFLLFNLTVFARYVALFLINQ